MAEGSLGDSVGNFLYSANQQANEAVQDQLSALSVTSLAVIFGAGLVTSLSPCTLSVLPLTLGYIGAFGMMRGPPPPHGMQGPPPPRPGMPPPPGGFAPRPGMPPPPHNQQQ